MNRDALGVTALLLMSIICTGCSDSVPARRTPALDRLWRASETLALDSEGMSADSAYSCLIARGDSSANGHPDARERQQENVLCGVFTGVLRQAYPIFRTAADSQRIPGPLYSFFVVPERWEYSKEEETMAYVWKEDEVGPFGKLDMCQQAESTAHAAGVATRRCQDYPVASYDSLMRPERRQQR